MKSHFRITVAVVAGILFLATTVAHACIGTVAAGNAHHHGGLQGGGLAQTSHAEAQDESCKSIRDRSLSLASRSFESHSLVVHLNLISAIGHSAVAAMQMFTAERPPGAGLAAVVQSPLYILISVFRI